MGATSEQSQAASPESAFAASQGAFAAAAQWFVETAARIGDRWDEPALGEWDVRALVGHTSRSLLTVEAYLADPAEAVAIETSADYYRATREIASGPGVAERGRQAGAALGDDPAAAVAEIAARVVPLIRDRLGSDPVNTIVGGMRLGEYLPTRTLELVVHTCDLATALGIDPAPPQAAARETLGLIADLAVGDGDAATLLLSLTGRRGLPSGYSAL